MSQVVIENPVINSPFAEPQRHFRFSDEGITNEIVAQRRTSSYFIPIAATKKKGKQQFFDTEWTQDRVEENKFINQVRSRVKQWRENKHFGVTRTTAQLLQYWTRPERERRLFFCQVEALETLILGSTQHVDFDTTKPTYTTRPDCCHVSHVVADTESWEQKLAQTLEDMPEVFAYVKNQNLGFTIPYTLNDEEHNYYPDFIVRIDDGHTPSPRDEGVGRGPGRGAADNFLNLILECTGQKKKDKEAKVTTAQTLWIPAVNGHGEFGRWAFLEISDPWDAKNEIAALLKTGNRAR